MPKLKHKAYEFDVFPKGTLSLDEVDPDKDAGADVEDQLEALETELFHLQVKAYLKERRAAFVFEGWDAAGKGGVIKRLTAQMDPRGYKVWPIGAPHDVERRQHYLWRFW